MKCKYCSDSAVRLKRCQKLSKGEIERRYASSIRSVHMHHPGENVETTRSLPSPRDSTITRIAVPATTPAAFANFPASSGGIAFLAGCEPKMSRPDWLPYLRDSRSISTTPYSTAMMRRYALVRFDSMQGVIWLVA
jgi:hypothetical protein